MVSRNDDLERYVAQLKAEAFQSHKPYTRWVGEVVVPLQGEQDPHALIMDAGENWTVSVKEHMIGVYAWLYVSYTIHGANANAAEKRFSELFGVAREDVKIRTTRTEKIVQ